MAEYRLICIAGQVPPNTTAINVTTDCPGSSGWVLDTDWCWSHWRVSKGAS